MKQIKRFLVAVLLLSCALLASCADKKAAGILYIKAAESYRQKDFANADAFINQSLNCDKTNKQAVLLKAKIHLFQGQYKEASKLFYDLYKSESDNKNLQRYLRLSKSKRGNSKSLNKGQRRLAPLLLRLGNCRKRKQSGCPT